MCFYYIRYSGYERSRQLALRMRFTGRISNHFVSANKMLSGAYAGKGWEVCETALKAVCNRNIIIFHSSKGKSSCLGNGRQRFALNAAREIYLLAPPLQLSRFPAFAKSFSLVKANSYFCLRGGICFSQGTSN